MVWWRKHTPKAGEGLFYGIGAQKSGTTWLYHYLLEHPQVFMPRVKEFDYFWVRENGTANRKAAQLVREMHEQLEPGKAPPQFKQGAHIARVTDSGLLVSALLGRSSYGQVFDARDPAEHKAYGEISPSYAMLSVESFREMHALNPAAKFVFIMRDPIKRFWSSIRMLVARNEVNMEVYGTVQKLFLQKLKEPNEHLVAMTDYAGTIKRLEEAVPASLIHYMFYEDLFAGDTPRGEAAVNRLTDFLGIDRRQPDLGRKIWVTDDRKVKSSDMDAEMLAAARRSFGPVYAATRKKFGAALPPEWDSLAGTETPAGAGAGSGNVSDDARPLRAAE